MFDFTRKLNLYPEKISWALKDDVSSSLSTVFLDLSTNICNFKCYFCDSQFHPHKSQQFTKERLIRLVDEMYQLNVNSVLICADGGEPFMHEAIIPLVKKIHSLGIHIGIYTNGSILRDGIEEIFPYFDFIRISLNASNKQTHKLVHRYKNDIEWENVKKFIGFALRYNKNVGVSFLLLRENFREMYDASCLCRQLGLRYIEFKPVYTLGYQIDPFLYEEDVKNYILKEYKKCMGLQTKNFKIILNNQLKEYFNGSSDITNSLEHFKCITSRLRLVISPSGCYLCTPHRGQMEFSIGNPQKESLKEIWEGEKHHLLWNFQCKYKCSYYSQNQTLLNILQSKDMKSMASANTNKTMCNKILQDSFL